MVRCSSCSGGHYAFCVDPLSSQSHHLSSPSSSNRSHFGICHSDHSHCAHLPSSALGSWRAEVRIGTISRSRLAKAHSRGRERTLKPQCANHVRSEWDAWRNFSNLLCTGADIDTRQSPSSSDFVPCWASLAKCCLVNTAFLDQYSGIAKPFVGPNFAVYE